jgi:ATP-dependent RNA helicase RhlE
LKDIEKLIKRSLERVVIEGFEQSAVASRARNSRRVVRASRRARQGAAENANAQVGKSTGRPQQHHTGSRHR